MNLNLQINRGLDGKFQRLDQIVDGFRDKYLEYMAAEIVQNSPSDTGTYVTNDNIGTTEVSATLGQSGQRRPSGTGPFDHPRHQQYIQEGFEKLLADIVGLPDETVRVVVSNATTYQNEVEYEHGYAVYGKAAREHSRIARDAAAAVKSGGR